MLVVSLGVVACGGRVVFDSASEGPGGGDGGAAAAYHCPNPTVVAPAEHGASYVDVHGGWVYYNADGVIARAPAAGGGAAEIVYEQIAPVEDLDVDASGVYVAVKDGRIVRLAPKTWLPTTLADDGYVGWYGDIRVDETHVYYRHDCRYLARVPKKGGALETIAAAEGCLGGFTLHEDDVYFYDFDDGSVARVAKNGGAITTLVEGAQARAGGESGPANGIAVGDGQVYWVSDELGLIAKVATTGGPMSVVAEGLDGVDDVIVGDGFVYWSEDDRVARAPLGGGPVVDITAELTSIAPMALALDDARLYFTDYMVGGSVWSICR